MKICIDSDATGRQLRRIICGYLATEGHEITDLNSPDGDHYPEIGWRLALRIAKGQFERGILVCGTGIGMAIVANKVRGVLAGCCHTPEMATRLVESNNAQVLTIGCEDVPAHTALLTAAAFAKAEMQERRNAKRIHELESLQWTSR